MQVFKALLLCFVSIASLGAATDYQYPYTYKHNSFDKPPLYKTGMDIPVQEGMIETKPYCNKPRYNLMWGSQTIDAYRGIPDPNKPSTSSGDNSQSSGQSGPVQ